MTPAVMMRRRCRSVADTGSATRASDGKKERRPELLVMTKLRRLKSLGSTPHGRRATSAVADEGEGFLPRRPDGRSWRCRLSGAGTRRRLECQWDKEYLTNNPVYSPRDFCHHFRIPLNIFCSLHDKAVAIEPRFKQQTNAARKAGHTSTQKVLMCLFLLGTGAPLLQEVRDENL